MVPNSQALSFTNLKELIIRARYPKSDRQKGKSFPVEK